MLVLYIYENVDIYWQPETSLWDSIKKYYDFSIFFFKKHLL